MAETKIVDRQVKELLLQALETEFGGVEVYKTALDCVRNAELRTEWERYLEETEEHVQVVRDLCDRFNVNAEEETAGRAVTRDVAKSLVDAMNAALESGKELAELVAAECVVFAETKDHLNWELVGELAKRLKSEGGKALKSAHDKVEPQEDEHLYHTQGWCRELWIESLGMPAVLPPPEEEMEVKTAIDAARAKKARSRMT